MSGRGAVGRGNASVQAARRAISSYEVGLFAAVLLLVGVSLLCGVVSFSRGRVRGNAHEILMGVVTACQQLYREYGGWPGALQTEGYDMEFGARRRNRELMNILTAIAGQGNPGHSVNPVRLVFLRDVDFWRRGRAGMDQTGDLLDPWGTPVRVVIDSNDDGFCTAETGEIEPVADEKAIAWSAGRDRIFGTDDDIHSWRRIPPRH